MLVIISPLFLLCFFALVIGRNSGRDWEEMRLSPFSPYLPRYPGPHQVGTIEVELSLPEELHRTFGHCTVKTLLVRLFYPTTATARGSRPRWAGQGSHVIQGYARFLGIKESLLKAASFLGLRWTEIPAISNAPVAPLAASSGATWPCMLFSHGLGGNRNAYSQISGSIAAGGVVVMAVEHRDNSAAISIVKTDDGAESVVEYISIKDSTADNIAKRRHQMSQRSYEMKLGLELFRAMYHTPTTTTTSGGIFDLSRHPSLLDFRDKLDCGPGRLIIGGHSFGAATSVNCCKDTTTRLPTDAAQYKLHDEFRACVLLDVWTEVLVDSAAQPLNVPTLGVSSQAFQNWSGNWQAVVRLLKSNNMSNSRVLNKLCWIKGSAHLSQSDFQLLFPTATKYAFKAAIDPHVAMDLNVRAVREFLRSVGVGEEPPDPAIFDGSEEEVVMYPLSA